jgi:hypothetical protein
MWLHLLNMINATFAYGVLYFQSIDMTLYNTVIATLQMILASLIGLTIEAIIIKCVLVVVV